MQLFSFIILILSIIIHEISHGYMALYLGDTTAKYEGRLTLNPLKHIDPIGSIVVPILTSFTGVTFGWAKPVPYNPYNLRNRRVGEVLVALAGPASNIAIAIVFGLVVRYAASAGYDIATTPWAILSLSIVLVNSALAVFNLMPIPPLDGSKVLFFLIPDRYASVRTFLERYQFVLFLVFIYFLWNHFVPLIYITASAISGVAI